MPKKVNRPQVGAGMIIKNGTKILLGRRMKKFGFGMLCLPGGHVELMETAELAARRETEEECNLQVGKVEMIGFSEDFYPKDQKHYITIFFVGEYIGGEPRENEPKKISDWRWYDIDDLKNMTDDLWKPCIEKFKMLGWI